MPIRCVWFSGHPSESHLRALIVQHKQTSSDLAACFRASGYPFSEHPREIDAPELRDEGFSADQIAAGKTVVSFQIEISQGFGLPFGIPYLDGNYIYDSSGKLIVGRATTICFGM